MRVLIFANGSFSQPEKTLASIKLDDYIIAADGGTLHCLRLGVQPHLVVGDFDSLEPEILKQLKNNGTRMESHPQRKDETDLELALHAAVREKPHEVIIYGALGARWDMTLANMLILAHSDYRHITITVVDGSQYLNLLRGGEKLMLTGLPGDIVSLIPLDSSTSGIQTKGLEYSLTNETLTFGTARGVSNVLRESPASISLEKGTLVCVHIKTQEM